MARVSSLEIGDEVLFNSRSIPCTVEGYVDLKEKVGRVFVKRRVQLRGPEDTTIWLENTGSNRVRVMPSSVPYGVYANVERLEVV